jgi:cell division protease FtsH
MAHSVLKEHMDELHRISNILIERETIDKDQFLRLLAGETEEAVFDDEQAAVTEPAGKPADEPRRAPKPRPFPLPGATMQPPAEPEAT